MFLNIKSGRSVGSLMDKSLNQDGLSRAFTNQLGAISKTKFHFKEGGLVDPIEEEIFRLEQIAGLRPMSAMDAYYVELAKDRLNYLYDLQKKKP
jgi:hypothetical protein